MTSDDDFTMQLLRIPGEGWALYTPTSNYYLLHDLTTTPAPAQAAPASKWVDPPWLCPECSRDLRGLPQETHCTCGHPR